MGRGGTAKQIRYITGRGGSLRSGLAAHLHSLTDDFAGVAVDSALLKQSFDEQLRVVRELWRAAHEAPLIATSYGGYLLLQTLIDSCEAPSRVLLLSPLLGRSLNAQTLSSSRPPREKLLSAALDEGRVTRPGYVSLVTGDADDVCCPALAERVAGQLQLDNLELLPGEGHMIRRDLVAAVVSEYLDAL